MRRGGGSGGRGGGGALRMRLSPSLLRAPRELSRVAKTE
jgi:hypothetical protein